MSIAPFDHYSIQNNPTVYDEEALTALEAIGRLGHKVNECVTAVNGWNVPNIIHVSPTGDKTGELDRAVIQGKLDKGYAVQLAPGEYYLNGPLIFRPGYMLRGESQLNTVLNCKAGFIDHESIVSVDHVEVRDVRVKGPGEGVGIDISRKVQGIETGGRYAHFMNVYLSGYHTGVMMSGCWCTNFTHCRIEAEAVCVEQKGSCNHIKYDHCMFLGPVDTKTSTAIKITAEGGAENYGISVDHCDFERHKYAIHAYYCVALNVNAVYVEGVDTVFQLDSCPGFLCAGGYISYPRIVLQGGKTNTLPLYNKSGGAIRDVFIKVNSLEKWPMMSTPDSYPVITENITVQNDGGGTCFANAQHYSSIYNGHSKFENLRITMRNVPLSQANVALENVQYFTAGKQYKVVGMFVSVNSGFTHTGTAGFIVGKPWDGNNYDPDFYVSIPAGTYNAGHEFVGHINGDIAPNYEKLIHDDMGYMAAHVITPVSAANVTANITLSLAVGPFKL